MLRPAGSSLLLPSRCCSCLGPRASRALRPDKRLFASVHEPAPDDPEAPSAGPRRPIRERLRDFVSAQQLPAPVTPLPRDFAPRGATQNAMTRVESRTLVQIDGVDMNDSVSTAATPEEQLLGDGGGFAHLDDDGFDTVQSPQRPFGAVAPQAGDLLEVSTDSWRVQLLAVCLGNFRGVDHFYTNTGRWFVSSGVRSLFGVVGFASPAELAPIIAALPSGCVLPPGEDDLLDDAVALDDMLQRMQELKMGPSRADGAGLIHKMNAFSEKTAAIHMAHAPALENAFLVLQTAAPDAGPFMALADIAAVLLRKGGHRIHGQVHGETSYGRHLPIRHLNMGGDAKAHKDEFIPEAMYAVHRAITHSEFAFRPLTANTGRQPPVNGTGSGDRTDVHTRSCIFALARPADVDIVRDVEHLVRAFYESPERIRIDGPLPDNVLKHSFLGQFVLGARKAIDRSRKTRSWSPYGMLEPEERTKHPKQKPKHLKNQKQEPPLPEWTATDQIILRFMHLWASFQRFSDTSRLHWVGGAVLRAVDRYGEAEYLTASTGWTFLQEIGWLTPWDIAARYTMSLPDVQPLRSGVLQRQIQAPWLSKALPSVPKEATEASATLGDDIFAGRRHRWTGLPVYCIDAPEAADIDDGISIERTDNPDEFWIRIHVADPASCIAPGSRLAEQAVHLPQTVYLPGFEERMLPDEIVRERFSLAPDRPCLTFGAKVNRHTGAVLDVEITPGSLDRVVFISPAEVAGIVADTEAAIIEENRTVTGRLLEPPAHLELPAAATSFSVGTPPAAAATSDDPILNRHMTTVAELSATEREDLCSLMAVATSLRAVRVANGAMPLYWPRPSVAVSLAGTDTGVAPTGTATAAVADEDLPALRCSGDPYIRIWYEGADNDSSAAAGNAGNRLVESIMRLAGEVAADWCHERGIAVPFRGQPDAARQLPRLRTLTRDHVYPALAAGRRAPESALRALRRLLGPDDVTAVAVPHITMGAARYVKATSPLRRYADLVTHWQIEGALRQEMAQATPGEADSQGETTTPVGPPFSREQLEREVLPLLRVRERAIRALDDRAGRSQWMLQALVRGWLAEGEQSKKGGKKGKATAHSFDKLHFTVSSVNQKRYAVHGRLDWFDCVAEMGPDELNGSQSKGPKLAPLNIDEVSPGQVYPVALEHVDVHGNRVFVRRTGEALA